MANIGPQKRKPKKTDAKQSERFKKTARELGVDESVERFEQTFKQIAPARRPNKKT
jgi:hypothetical protein